jgi:type II secretory ATPase GspE/PulE/Tfp pilus assembly ATPase PilB-like protein
MIIAEAVKAKTSDIHIEPQERYVKVRFRIDGELRNIFKYDKNIHESVVSRIKIISSLDITNRRLPQDGSAHASFHGKEIDLRISTIPSLYGEKIVIRLLDQSVGLIPLEDLAMPEYIKNSIIEIFKRPQGMLIVTGPTGSGKTTTLYACLNQLRSDSKNIVTIEDPVEYKLDGITQIPVNESIGRTFASVLRSILRQDPDVIKVGEIRDAETAEIAIKASLTGHLVLTTLHTNSTIATITRLINIGIQPYLISSAVSAILAQRLVRRICIHCRTESEITEDILSFIESHNLPAIKKHYHGTGCQKCSNTGYSGRIAVYEYLLISPALRKLLAHDTGESSLLIAAKKEGFASLFEDAWNKVKDGITTVEEVIAKVPVD